MQGINQKSKTAYSIVEDVQASWDGDVERFILYADIMGFKDRVSTKNHSELKKELLVFISDFKKKISPLLSGDYLRWVQFSDSIIIVANGIDSKMFNIITKAAICLMHIAMKHKFPIKGVLSKGVFTYDKKNELYFGQPLVDAFLLQEELYFYGIVAHHSVEPLIKKYSYLKLPYYKGQIPLKKGKTSHYHLSWHLCKENLSSGDIKSKAEVWLSNIEELVSGAPRIYVDNTRTIIQEEKQIIFQIAKQIIDGAPTTAV